MAVYTHHLLKTLAPTTVWSRLSMVKKSVLVHHGVLIDPTLAQEMLKQASATHKKKKSAVFTPQKIAEAFANLGDSDYIVHKLAAVLMLHGGLRRDEICHLTWSDIT